MMLYVDVIFVFRLVDFSRWLIVIAWALSNMLSILKALVIDHFRNESLARGIGRRRVVVVGSGPTARTYCAAIAEENPRLHELVGNFGKLGSLSRGNMARLICRHRNRA